MFVIGFSLHDLISALAAHTYTAPEIKSVAFVLHRIPFGKCTRCKIVFAVIDWNSILENHIKHRLKWSTGIEFNLNLCRWNSECSGRMSAC